MGKLLSKWLRFGFKTILAMLICAVVVTILLMVLLLHIMPEIVWASIGFIVGCIVLFGFITNIAMIAVPLIFLKKVQRTIEQKEEETPIETEIQQTTEEE